MPEQNSIQIPPKYSGKIQTRYKENEKVKILGRVTLWENKSTNPNAPVLTGQLVTKYGTSLIALWNHSPRKDDVIR